MTVESDDVAMHLVVNDKTGQRQDGGADDGLLRRVMESIVRIAGGAWLDSRRREHKRLCVLETLPIGVKKQLLLVSCDGERFLVGTGPESVQTIVRVGGEQSVSGKAAEERI